MPGKLYVVATPIGNLDDISNRATEALGAVDTVLCEDTRVTAKLINALGIDADLESYHQHSGARKMKDVSDRLMGGETFALVSDAGTPGISDPGGRLVAHVVQTLGSDVVISPIPGPNAAAAALSISGFPAHHFTFLGFPPHKKGRNTFFKNLADMEETIVFYESKHRVLKALKQCAENVPGRSLVVCRELTKKFETVYRGTPQEVTSSLKSDTVKGEFVVIIGPAD